MSELDFMKPHKVALILNDLREHTNLSPASIGAIREAIESGNPLGVFVCKRCGDVLPPEDNPMCFQCFVEQSGDVF